MLTHWEFYMLLMCIQYLLNVFVPYLSFPVKGTFTKWQTNQEMFCLQIFTRWLHPYHHTQIRRPNTIITRGPLWAPLPSKGPLSTVVSHFGTLSCEIALSCLLHFPLFIMAHDSSWVSHHKLIVWFEGHGIWSNPHCLQHLPWGHVSVEFPSLSFIILCLFLKVLQKLRSFVSGLWTNLISRGPTISNLLWLTVLRFITSGYNLVSWAFKMLWSSWSLYWRLYFSTLTSSCFSEDFFLNHMMVSSHGAWQDRLR